MCHIFLSSPPVTLKALPSVLFLFQPIGFELLSTIGVYSHHCLTGSSYKYYRKECIIHRTLCSYNMCTLVLNTLLHLSPTYLYISTYLYSIVLTLSLSPFLPAVPSHLPPSLAEIRPRGCSQQQEGVRECKAIISLQHASFS